MSRNFNTLKNVLNFLQLSKFLSGSESLGSAYWVSRMTPSERGRMTYFYRKCFIVRPNFPLSANSGSSKESKWEIIMRRDLERSVAVGGIIFGGDLCFWWWWTVVIFKIHLIHLLTMGGFPHIDFMLSKVPSSYQTVSLPFSIPTTLLPFELRTGGRKEERVNKWKGVRIPFLLSRLSGRYIHRIVVKESGGQDD